MSKSVDISKLPKFSKDEVKLILQDAGITKKPKSQRLLLAYIFERWDEEKFGKLGLDGKILHPKIVEECLEELDVSNT